MYLKPKDDFLKTLGFACKKLEKYLLHLNYALLWRGTDVEETETVEETRSRRWALAKGDRYENEQR